MLISQIKPWRYISNNQHWPNPSQSFLGLYLYQNHPVFEIFDFKLIIFSLSQPLLPLFPFWVLSICFRSHYFVSTECLSRIAGPITFIPLTPGSFTHSFVFLPYLSLSMSNCESVHYLFSLYLSQWRKISLLLMAGLQTPDIFDFWLIFLFLASLTHFLQKCCQAFSFSLSPPSYPEKLIFKWWLLASSFSHKKQKPLGLTHLDFFSL